MSAEPGHKPGVDVPPWFSQSAVAMHVPEPTPGTLHEVPPDPLELPLEPEPVLDPAPLSKEILTEPPPNPPQPDSPWDMASAVMIALPASQP
jgi:hypothetical protein